MRQISIPPVFLYIVDEFGQITNEVTQKFDNPEKYMIRSHLSFRHLLEDKDLLTPPIIKRSGIRIILYVINKHLQNNNTVSEALEVLEKIKKLPGNFSVIFLVDTAYKDKGQPVLEAGAAAWIVNNPNAIHWIDNQVKAAISRNNLDKKRRAKRLALRILFAYLAFVLILTLLAKFLFPWYF